MGPESRELQQLQACTCTSYILHPAHAHPYDTQIYIHSCQHARSGVASSWKPNPRIEREPLGTSSIQDSREAQAKETDGAWVEITLNRLVSAATRLLKFNRVGTCERSRYNPLYRGIHCPIEWIHRDWNLAQVVQVIPATGLRRLLPRDAEMFRPLHGCILRPYQGDRSIHRESQRVPGRCQLASPNN
jgi:hypothetical protein